MTALLAPFVISSTRAATMGEWVVSMPATSEYTNTPRPFGYNTTITALLDPFGVNIFACTASLGQRSVA